MKKQCPTLFVGFILLCMLLNPLTGFTQAITENRIEFEQGEDYESYTLTPFGKYGLLLYAKEEKGNTWKLERYNTDLKPEQKQNFEVPRGYYSRARYTSDEDLSMFYSNKSGKYIFYNFSGEELNLEKHIGQLPKKTIVKSMIAEGNLAYIACSNKKGPVLIQLNIKTGKTTLLPINISPYTPKYLSIERVQVLKEDKTVMVYINAMNKKDHNLYVMQFNEEGKEISKFNLSKSTEKKLSSVSASALGNNEYIFTGTYSSKNAAYSEGMYMCKTTKADIDFMKFYSFTDFNEFFSYLPERKQEKIEKKKERYDEKNKELTFNYLIAEHPIKKIGDNYILIGEAYYPTYRQEARTTTVNGQTTTSYVSVFDGYQYTHATVAGFDGEGNKLWDHTFELWPSYKPFFVKRFISSSTENDQISLLFASGNNINSLGISPEGEVLKKESHSFIVSSDDQKVKSSFSNIEFWYDNNFIAFGYQTIKDSKESFGNKKRRVFFINKVTYQ